MKAKLNRFAYEVYKSVEDDEPIGGADSREMAEAFAKAIAGVVKEAVIFFATGELEIAANGAVKLDGGNLEITISQALDVYPTRNNPVNLGYVDVIIKPARLVEATEDE